jgi:PAS domain S-box-containing protein
MRTLPEMLDRRARILVVDDERPNRQLIEAMLEPEGYEVRTSGSGEEAIALAAHEDFDLILLDVMMPGMDGYDVARNVKENSATRNVPIIMVTALGDRDARLRGLRAGAEDFLTKPIDRAELCVRVKNLLRLKAYGDYFGKYSEILEQEVRERTAALGERSERLEEQAVALRRSEERTNYALGGARMGVWELEIHSWRLSWSDTMASVFGLEPHQAPTELDAFLKLVHADDRQVVGEALTYAVHSGTDFGMEFRVLWPDGTMRWMAGRARVVRGANNAPLRLLGVGSDISERKSLEAQLRQSQKMEAVGQLASGVAHDFNNLLTVMMSYSDIVLADMRPDDPARDDLLQVVQAAQSAASLTRQLLAFSRKQILRPKTIDINELVTGMEMMLNRLTSDNVELVIAAAPKLGAVRADHGQLEQVLMNLVVNASDAMPHGGRVTITTADAQMESSVVNDVTTAAGWYTRLSVSDAGDGMDDATREHIFEPFFTTKEPGKGTGLGLATVYGIVQQSGGFIQVESVLEQGSTFSVYLPHCGDDTRSAPRRAAAGAPTRSAPGASTQRSANGSA